MKAHDGYLMFTRNNSDFNDAVSDMEANSKWIPAVWHKHMSLEVVTPIEVKDLCCGLDYDLAMDTAQNTSLLLRYVDPYKGPQIGLVRDTAVPGLIYNIIGIGGNNITKICVANLVTCANIFIEDYKVKNKDVLLLERYGKISAAHSNADGGYAIMPIPELIQIATDSLKHRCGTVAFECGSVSHSETQALWSLPDVQDEVSKKYSKALSAAVTSNYGADLMPAVRFCSSDTSNSMATLMPVFLHRNVEYRFVDGISVRHTKRRSGKYGIELFRDQVDGIYAMFDDISEVITKLAGIEVTNGINCFISLCNEYGINQKYGSPALEVIDRFCTGGRSISAFDLYMVLSSVPAVAESNGTEHSIVNRLGDCVAKAVHADWSYHDVCGTVAWKTTSKSK